MFVQTLGFTDDEVRYFLASQNLKNSAAVIDAAIQYNVDANQISRATGWSVVSLIAQAVGEGVPLSKIAQIPGGQEAVAAYNAYIGATSATAQNVAPTYNYRPTVDAPTVTVSTGTPTSTAAAIWENTYVSPPASQITVQQTTAPVTAPQTSTNLPAASALLVEAGPGIGAFPGWLIAIVAALIAFS